MPAPVFVPMNAFSPDGGLFGPELSLVQNALPVHAGWNGLQKKQIVASVADGPMTGGYVHIYQQTVQLQKARPEFDTTPGTWLTSPAGGSLFAQLSEANPNDAQFIYAPDAPAAQATKIRFTDIVDPSVATGHILRWRYRIPATPSAAWTVKAELFEGSTLIATDTATGAASTAYVQREYTLTAGEANSITTGGYQNLFVTFTATVPGSRQFARPAADVALESWTNQAGSSSNIFQAIDETVASDADFIRSPPLAPGGAAYRYQTSLSALINPLDPDPWVLRIRNGFTNLGASFKARLKLGETVIREHGPETATSSLLLPFSDTSITLNSAEVALITAFDEPLVVEFEASYPALAASAATQGVGPDSTIENSGGWAPTGAATLQEAVDEAVASDLDFITSPAADAEASCELGLVAVDPLVHSGHVLKVRCTGPVGVSLRVELLEGGGLIKGDTITLGAYATETLTLTTGEAALIGDYANLSVRLTRLVSGFAGVAEVSWVRFETPEPARALISWVELEIPSASRAEISWTEFEVPGVVQAYKGDIPTLFCNSKTKIYEVTNGGFTDRSKGGGYGTGDTPGGGRFCSFGNDVIWTNRADPVQYRAGNTGSFADLITSTRVPKARFAAPVRDHLVLADINLTGYFPDHVWWSAFDDARTFVDQGDAGANPATQSDQQRIVSCEGQITGLVGGDYGVIFKRNSMHLMGWQGGQLVFRFDDISRAVGTPFPSSIVSTPYGVMWFDGATFQLYNGGTGEASISDIGNGILSQYMADNLAQIEPASIAEEDELMMGHWDPYARVVIWTYRDNGGTAYKHTRGIVFNPRENRWGTLYDPNLFAAVMASRKNVITSDSHLLKGTLGFDWSGTTTSWFQFNGPATYEMVFGSKRQALGIEGVEPERSPVAARLMGVLPVFSTFPAGSAPPALSVVVTASNDPWFYTDARQKTTDTSRASAQGILPCDITATWFLFSVTIPELTGQQARAFRGLYCFWAPAGQPGVTG